MKISFGINDLEKIVQDVLISKLKEYNIFTFQGPLGVGKTTLIRALLRLRGVDGPVTSPTFTYVNSYTSKKGLIFNHFDLYRIPSLESFLNCGFGEYFQGENDYNLIEWPSVINGFLSSEGLSSRVCEIQLSYCLDRMDKRILEVVD